MNAQPCANLLSRLVLLPCACSFLFSARQCSALPTEHQVCFRVFCLIITFVANPRFHSFTVSTMDTSQMRSNKNRQDTRSKVGFPVTSVIFFSALLCTCLAAEVPNPSLHHGLMSHILARGLQSPNAHPTSRTTFVRIRKWNTPANTALHETQAPRE